MDYYVVTRENKEKYDFIVNNRYRFCTPPSSGYTADIISTWTRSHISPSWTLPNCRWSYLGHIQTLPSSTSHGRRGPSP